MLRIGFWSRRWTIILWEFQPPPYTICWMRLSVHYSQVVHGDLTGVSSILCCLQVLSAEMSLSRPTCLSQIRGRRVSVTLGCPLLWLDFMPHLSIRRPLEATCDGRRRKYIVSRKMRLCALSPFKVMYIPSGASFLRFYDTLTCASFPDWQWPCRFYQVKCRTTIWLAKGKSWWKYKQAENLIALLMAS
jgi:hypothetical protein